MTISIDSALAALNIRLSALAPNATPEDLAYLGRTLEAFAGKATLVDVQTTGDAQNSRVVSTGDTQNARLLAVGETQNNRVASTGETQNTRLTSVGDAQNTRVTSAGDAQVARIAQTGGAKIVWAGWDANHGRAGASWQRPTLDSHHINPDPAYCTISGGEITIVKPGLYMTFGNVMQYTANHHAACHLSVMVNGNRRTHTYAYQHGWNDHSLDWVEFMPAGTKLWFEGYANGGDPYNWHAHSYHARAFLIYLGA